MNEPVAALQAAAQENAVLRAALDAAKSADEIMAAAAAHGLTVTQQDLAESEGSVTDTELEGVSAGYYTVWPECSTFKQCH